MARYKRLDDRTKEQQQADFLESFEQTANITMSCKAVNVPRRTIYNWLTDDPEFKKNFGLSSSIGLGVLEDEAVRRAVQGVNKPVYQSGRKVGYVQEYSDTLMIFLLKARDPEKYRERFSGELSAPGGKPLIPSGQRDLSMLSEEELRLMIEIEKKISKSNVP